MATLDELRRENARLKAREQVRSDFNSYDQERKRLSRENFSLKHPNAARLGRGLVTIGSALGGVVRTTAVGLNSRNKQKSARPVFNVPKFKF